MEELKNEGMDIFDILKQVEKERRITARTYVSPAYLKDRYFYWEACDAVRNPILVSIEGEESPVPLVLRVRKPETWFYDIYNLLFINIVMLVTIEKSSKDDMAVKMSHKTCIILLEYLYYLLDNQLEHEDKLLKIVNEKRIQDVMKEFKYEDVNKWIQENVHSAGVDYQEYLYNLLYMFLDLFWFIHNLGELVQVPDNIARTYDIIRRHL